MRIGVGLSIPELSTRGGRFSPASLFAGGVQGAWYAPDDFSTLFQDFAGTTPVTAVEQPVGLMLDKSQGLVLGTELITNGDFSGGTTGWTLGAGWSISGGAAVASSVAGTDLTSSYVTTSGKWYQVQFTVSGYSAGIVRPFIGQAETINVSANGTYTYRLLSASPTNVKFFAFSSFTASIDNVSVKELAGNHASQATAASRPVLRARYNLLTYSEQFDNAGWAKGGLNITGTPAWVNAAVAPDGTTTAEFLIPQATTANHSVNSATSVTVVGVNTFSVYAKAGGLNYLQMLYGSGSDYANFNLTGAGSVTQNSGGAPTITSVGSGWYRCTITSTFAAATTVYLQPIPTGTETRYAAYLGDAANGVYVWGADLRTGSSAGTYQRIAAATDYATAGFLPYLALDGTDDSMATGSINFSTTDKMFVCAGLTKLNTSAAFNCLIETGATATNGVSIFAPDSNNNNYSFWLKNQSRPVASNYAAPITNVISVSQDTAAVTVALQTKTQINGADVAHTGGTLASATNFANEALNIGRRGGTTLPFNGRIYQMVICGKELNASEIASTEAYVNARTGAY